MSDTSAAVGLLARALRQAETIVSAVEPGQLDLPTPCTEWTVRDLIRHMVGGVRSFRGVVEGRRMVSFDVTVDDAELADGYRVGADALIAAWRVEGVLDRSMTMVAGEVPAAVPLNLQIAETAMHSWDLATATGQRVALDPDVAEAALAFTTKNMGPEQRGRSFGPERAAPPNAGPYERLAAFTGREVVA